MKFRPDEGSMLQGMAHSSCLQPYSCTATQPVVLWTLEKAFSWFFPFKLPLQASPSSFPFFPPSS
eukprot:COSAG02_NODE_16697_length_1063_cov_0.864108_1_plen_64_part_01